MVWPLVVLAAAAAVKVVGGLFGANKQNDATRHQMMANQIEQQIAERDQGIQRRDMIRQFRISQAQALAQASMDSGGTRSSGSKSVQSALTSQAESGLDFFTIQAAAIRARAENLTSANQALAAGAKIQSYTNLVGTALQGIAGLGGGAAAAASAGGGSAPQTASTSPVINSGFSTFNTNYISAATRAWSSQSNTNFSTLGTPRGS